MGRRPNFFIVGAPKSGTTSLAQYLAAHPAVFVSDPKEPSYFARELVHDAPAERRAAPWRYDESAYLDLFAGAGSQHIAVGEASTTYLYSQRAAAELRAFDPAAKVIVMLRDPVALVHALHAQKLLEGEETVHSFEEAWRLLDERRSGRGFARRPARPQLLQYGDVGRIGRQLQRLLGVFPRSQVKLIVFDDFVADPAAVYRDVLSFIEVPDDGRRDFGVHNQGRRVTSRWLWELATRRFEFLLAPYRLLKRKFGLEAGARLRARLLGASSTAGGRESLRPALYRELREYFEDDIRLLESLLSRSLAAWRADSEPK